VVEHWKRAKEMIMRGRNPVRAEMINEMAKFILSFSSIKGERRRRIDLLAKTSVETIKTLDPAIIYRCSSYANTT
jgi:hypothetical protein